MRAEATYHPAIVIASFQRVAQGKCGSRLENGRARALAPARPIFPLAVEQRHGVVPETHVDSNILADRTNGSRAAGPPRCRVSMQPARDEIFLNDVIRQPKRIAEVRIAACVQQLIGEYRQVLLVIRIADLQRLRGEVPALPITELTLRHLLDDPRDVIEPPGNLKGAIDDVVDHIPAMRYMQESKVTDLRNQAVGADGAKQSGAQGVGGGCIVGVDQNEFGYRIEEA